MGSLSPKLHEKRQETLCKILKNVGWSVRNFEVTQIDEKMSTRVQDLEIKDECLVILIKKDVSTLYKTC